ncbi:54S ribosomal protein L38, mitochondrial [Lodderomyces elongisporus]|uniref:Large ribosomal subunit protein uL14m n=1 Tax=Lodderomyces elongisporus (strain ATCC 11503 / CBS 2605 / JCM 1781 / NBRC 1676 / NRRL YB-4239) TaxID=379508 RepID=A5E2M4_LODEL|nr:54S ribosomal protein L38, mitochondrial [Lodderomyces elongisporus]EDK45682.1 50S ribosomal protein L14 [Lodderomyces elongisporus NRRL YB-4239]WLF80892.1 54S ribosomal protein L38, mitochondrial [Lodderomyces elongisporus]
MIYLKTLLNVIDNSGAQIVECIKVSRHGPKTAGNIGDIITCVVKKARPEPLGPGGKVSTQLANKVKRRDVCKAVIVRQKSPLRRPDGSVIRFDDNACVLINKNKEPIGTRINSVVAKELRERGFNKIASLAPRTW